MALLPPPSTLGPAALLLLGCIALGSGTRETPGFISYDRGGMQENKGCSPLHKCDPSLEHAQLETLASSERLRGLACGYWSEPCTDGKSSREPKVQTALK